jgi:multiple sugar transport system ATP-binding protein
MAAITLEGIHKRFAGGAVAVRNVDLEIRDGELFVLLGPSGCGKSTLLNIVVGLEEPTSGTVSVDGRSMNGVEPGKRDMAMVFQSYAIYPHMSVRENLAFPLQIAGVPAGERERRVAEAAEILELEELLDRRPATLSGGQRQRVAMGRAIVRDPVAFLLDEPLSNLDARLRGQMRTEIARLHRRLGTTTVYVTHDQTEALTLADRMAVLNRGEVQQVGTPREVYARPANRFVAGFLGSPPMTFMRGARDGDDVVLPMGRVRWSEWVGGRRPGKSAGGAGESDHLPRGWGEYADGSDVEVGVRPEDVREAGQAEVPSRATEGGADPAPQAAVAPVDAAANRPAQSTPAPSALLRFRARVELLEWLGAETYAHVEVEEQAAPAAGPRRGRGNMEGGRPDPEAGPSGERPQRLVARLSPRSTVKERDMVDLEVEARRLHFFDPATGVRLGDL